MRARPSLRAIKTPKVLVPPTPEQIRTLTSELDTRWSRATLKALDRLEEAIENGDAGMARNWAITGGVGTDKAFLTKGMPTSIVSNINEHRHDLVGIMEKLAVAAKTLNQNRAKRYVKVTKAAEVSL